MSTTHPDRVEAMLRDAAAAHAALLPQLPEYVRDALPVDAQGITEAIDDLAEAAGLTERSSRAPACAPTHSAAWPTAADVGASAPLHEPRAIWDLYDPKLHAGCVARRPARLPGGG